MAKQINFKYKDKEYILEFNRDTFKKAELAGFPLSRVEALEDNPSDAIEVIPELWYRAFQMHHPSVTRDEADEMYKSMDNKGGDGETDLGLIGDLVQIFSEPVAILFTEQGNTKWSKSWK